MQCRCFDEPDERRPASSTSVHPPEKESHLAADHSSSDSGDTDAHFAYHWRPHCTMSTVFRHSGWARTRARVYDALARVFPPSARHDNFACCGDHVRVLKSREDPPRIKLAGNYCHDRFCVPCANQRSRLIVNNLLALIPRVTVRMLTLTIRAENDVLAEKIAKIRHSLARLRKTKLWRKHVKGGVAFLEVKRSSRSDSWHVHYHALLEGKFFPHAHLKALWLKATGDSDIVHIVPAKTRNGIAVYASKYAGKPLDPAAVRDSDLLDEAIAALHGVHLVQQFGTWKHFRLTEPPDDGDWEDYCSLNELIFQASEGDERALAALKLLPESCIADALSVAVARGPPYVPASAPVSPQYRLFPDMSWYF